MRHGTNGFTSPPKEGVLRSFFALKNLTASAGVEPANLGTKGQHATSRPPKQLRQVTVTRQLKADRPLTVTNPKYIRKYRGKTKNFLDKREKKKSYGAIRMYKVSHRQL